MKFLIWALIAVIAYLLGNISTGLLVGRLFGTDIRKVGSGNAGTTNVMRTLGWVPSVATLLGDVIKAVLAVLIGMWLDPEFGKFIAGIAVVTGHNWPVFFGFKGGKVRIDHCLNLEGAQQLKNLILSAFPSADVIIGECRALCSFYAERGGLLVGFEDGI